MQSLQKIFNYKGQQVRMVIKNNQPWWVAKDVCDILDLGNSRMALERLDDDEKGVSLIDTPGGPQQMQVVNEPGLYTLILGSRKKEAKEFKRWITHEVLPSIRETGIYSLNAHFKIPQTYPEALRLAADLAEENLKLKPKAEMHDLFLSAGNNQPMSAVAKSLGIGRNKLFAFLRQKKVLRYNNEPYQEYLDRGYFKVVEKPIVKGGIVENITQTLVTAKGVDFIGRLLKQEEIVLGEGER